MLPASRLSALPWLAGGALAVALLVKVLRKALQHQPPSRSWKHGVEVRSSRIRNAGDGLFAAKDFQPGEELGEYYGRVLSLLEAYRLEDRDYLIGGFG
jgi:hypothetical protein